MKSRTEVESSTVAVAVAVAVAVSVADTANVAFDFKQSNLIDSNVSLHMHLTLGLSSALVKFDV